MVISIAITLRQTRPLPGLNCDREMDDSHTALKPIRICVGTSLYCVNISSGRKADTTKLGTSTTSLTFRSTATLQMQ